MEKGTGSDVPVVPPPAADSRFVAVDDGNASPLLLRSSCYAFPRDRSTWHCTGDIPLGIVCTPMAIPSGSLVASTITATAGGGGIPRHAPDDPRNVFVPKPRIFLDSTESAEYNSLDVSSSRALAAESLMPATPSTIPVLQSSQSQASTQSDGASFPWFSTTQNTKKKHGSNTNHDLDPFTTPPLLPLRCRHCQAYVNPFFDMSGGGSTCNLCGSRNSDIATEHRHSGDLVDAFRFGTVEYVVGGLVPQNSTMHDELPVEESSPYVTRLSPVQPVSLYALDLTCPHVPEYLALLVDVGRELALHAQRQPANQYAAANNMPLTYAPRMGICFVAASGIYIRPNSPNGRREAQYHVVSDVVEDPFCPLPLRCWTYDVSTAEGLMAWEQYVLQDLTQDVAILKQELRSYKTPSNLDGTSLSCGGAALAFLADALSTTGGRGTLITWRRPSYGIGKIPHRQESSESQQFGQRRDYHVYTPLQIRPDRTTTMKPEDKEASLFYETLGRTCSAARVALDVVMHTPARLPSQWSFLDIATLGELCRVTGGNLQWLDAPDWTDTLRDELVRQVTSFQGWDAVLKVRVSDGIRIKRLLSAPGVAVQDALADSPELELSTISSRTSIALELEHRVGGIPKKSPFCFVQSALLYTTITGQRRVRVSTLALRTTSVANDVYRSVDFGTVITLYSRECIERLRASVSDQERETLLQKTREALYQVSDSLLHCNCV
jgi:Sec23/Sec24 beta-sandwich domain/Sec23/Sec24 zinc finger/Sec23/Sec24 trunk domain